MRMPKLSIISSPKCQKYVKFEKLGLKDELIWDEETGDEGVVFGVCLIFLNECQLPKTPTFHLNRIK